MSSSQRTGKCSIDYRLEMIINLAINLIAVDPSPTLWLQTYILQHTLVISEWNNKYILVTWHGIMGLNTQHSYHFGGMYCFDLQDLWISQARNHQRKAGQKSTVCLKSDFDVCKKTTQDEPVNKLCKRRVTHWTFEQYFLCKIQEGHLYGQSSWLQFQRSRVRFPVLPDFLSSGSGTGFTQHHEYNWGATQKKWWQLRSWNLRIRP
jgi:hypothetical protein